MAKSWDIRDWSMSQISTHLAEHFDAVVVTKRAYDDIRSGALSSEGEGPGDKWNVSGLSPEAREYLALRQKGGRPISKRELQQALGDCEDALTATENALEGSSEGEGALDVKRLRADLNEALQYAGGSRLASNKIREILDCLFLKENGPQEER